MVAYNSEFPLGPRRTISSDVANRLRAALTARWDQTTESDGALTSALAEAAQDARERQLRPEELLLALKAIEEQVASAARRVDEDERNDFRQWLVGACLRAYFAEDGTP